MGNSLPREQRLHTTDACSVRLSLIVIEWYTGQTASVTLERVMVGLLSACIAALEEVAHRYIGYPGTGPIQNQHILRQWRCEPPHPCPAPGSAGVFAAQSTDCCSCQQCSQASQRRPRSLSSSDGRVWGPATISLQPCRANLSTNRWAGHWMNEVLH